MGASLRAGNHCNWCDILPYRCSETGLLILTDYCHCETSAHTGADEVPPTGDNTDEVPPAGDNSDKVLAAAAYSLFYRENP